MPYDSITTRDAAAALIPEAVSKEIIKSLPQASFALNMFRRVTMSRKQTRMPVLSVLPSAAWVNGDTGLKQTTELAWDNKYLTAEPIAVIVPISEDVLEDAEFDIWGEAKPLLIEAIGQKIDAAVLFGTNKPTSWPDSIVEGADAAGNTYVRGSVTDQDLAEDINQTMALVEADGFDVNGFIARVGLKASLRGLRDGTGAFIYQPGMTAGTPSSLYGEQLQYLKNGAWDAAEADLIAGDMSQAIIGLRADLRWKLLTEASLHDGDGTLMFNLPQQDMVALRVVMRIAYQVANPITQLNTSSSTRYPFSVLRPAGYT